MISLMGTLTLVDKRGELTRLADRRGATLARRTVGWAGGACPHTWTWHLRSPIGCHPDGEQAELLVDETASAPSADATTVLLTNRMATMTEVRRLFLYAMAVEQ